MQSATRKKRIWPKVVGIALLVFALLIGGMLAFILLGKGGTERLTLQGATALNLADGVFSGGYDGFRWSTDVEVTVKDHRIEGIRVTKPQVFAQEKTISTLADRVLSAQTTAVDAISGATLDSKAFLKAVENALNQAA